MWVNLRWHLKRARLFTSATNWTITVTGQSWLSAQDRDSWNAGHTHLHLSAATFNGVVCWCNNISTADIKRHWINWRARSDLGSPLDSLEVLSRAFCSNQTHDQHCSLLLFGWAGGGRSLPRMSHQCCGGVLCQTPCHHLCLVCTPVCVKLSCLTHEQVFFTCVFMSTCITTCNVFLLSCSSCVFLLFLSLV